MHHTVPLGLLVNVKNEGRLKQFSSVIYNIKINTVMDKLHSNYDLMEYHFGSSYILKLVLSTTCRLHFNRLLLCTFLRFSIISLVYMNFSTPKAECSNEGKYRNPK